MPNRLRKDIYLDAAMLAGAFAFILVGMLALSAVLR